MSQTVHGVMQKKRKQKLNREIKNLLFSKNNSGDYSSETRNIVSSTQILHSSSSFDLNENNILPLVPRKSALSASERNSILLEKDSQCEIGAGEGVDEPDWELPPSEQRRLRKRPEIIH